MPTSTFHNLPEGKKKRILDAAIKEFGQRNIDEGNIANIVKDAKISRGSLYQYFESKEDLYTYLFDTLRGIRSEYVKPAFQLYKQAPFLRFFEEFYLRDSEYLLRNPSHIELGKHLYTSSNPVARGLIQRHQSMYRDWFIVAIDYDKERGFIDTNVDSSVFADLCVHFVTDIFIFQSIYNQFSLDSIRTHILKSMSLFEYGILPRLSYEQ